MKYFNSLIILLLTVALLLSVLLPPKDNRPFVSINRENFEILIADTSVTVIDVRTPEEYEREHFPRAININVQRRDFERRIDSLDNTKIVAIYCRDGNRSKTAAAILSVHGFVVFELNEGIERRR
jgi:rhodanese-related sulfurtransferase